MIQKLLCWLLGQTVYRAFTGQKKKGAGMVMTIMLVAVCGWVAIVVFIIKPDIGDGVALSVCGGAVIGLAIVWLMKRWWFEGILRRPD